MRRVLRRIFVFGACALAVVLAVCADMQARVGRAAQPFIVARPMEAPKQYTAIVLGCYALSDGPSGCLEERLRTALDLYTNGRVQRLLLSGDHGTVRYDEVNTMREWLMRQGVPQEHIFLDHAGFDTYDTMVRARKVFQVEDALVVSQGFHVPRAVYLACAVGIDAFGVVADPPGGSVCGASWVREPAACAKAVLNVVLGASPKFLGPAIPITGSPQASFDQ
jgi:SanA protein